MATWSEGYVTDVPYTSNCYPEMAPGFLAYACLRQGLRPPALGEGSRYLELGCGQGFGLALFAAANPHMSFHGVDFIPAQIANANRLTREASLTNVTFEDASFRDLEDRGLGSLGKFDVIALHGVLSWVNAENRARLVRILDACLNPGGLAYVSYNCLPGWASSTPLRRFVMEHARRQTGDAQARVVAGLRAALQMTEAPQSYFGAMPFIKARIEEALAQNPAYLVHEYMHEAVDALYHADVANELDAARLSFAASANIADDLVNLAAPEALQPQIQAAQDPVWRETLLDYASHKPFRRDIYVRGRNPLGAIERETALDGTLFELVVSPDAATFEFPIPIGQLRGQPGVYGPIVQALADGAKSYAELRALPALRGVRDGAFAQAMTLLVGGRQIHPRAPLTAVETAPARRFNAVVMARAPLGEAHNHLAAPSTGGPVALDFTDQLALQAFVDDPEEPSDAVVRRGWDVMARTGRRLLRDGQVLMDPEANQAELARRLTAFPTTRLPLLRRLGLV